MEFLVLVLVVAVISFVGVETINNYFTPGENTGKVRTGDVRNVENKIFKVVATAIDPSIKLKKLATKTVPCENLNNLLICKNFISALYTSPTL
uniref:Wsv216-like protein n=1 Tax=Pasiphaea japonica whispovirus TaxID=2984286 RepID=A0A9C7F127_9VIRU|nr:MAG: wsv216-like protein [Pasiphaea japonica whispovirus]